ncbi:MAG: RidA family protein [Tissierellia bacterium]|nr:RidA family protein [Tissierellia bacterium]
MKYIHTEKSPKAIGPYSQATVINNTVYISGQIPLNPEAFELENDIKLATKRCLENLLNIVEAAGSSLEKIAKVNVYVTDIDDFSDINEVYEAFFKEHKPARALVEVSRLPKDAKIEIEAVAAL